jgi:DNA-binding NarL/FixJ family response regulator
MSMIRVLCVEDNPLVRAYLEQRLAIEPDIHVVSTVSHARGALTYLRQEAVDVVLLDYQLDDEDGMQMLDVINDCEGWILERRDGPAILFCTGYADEEFEARARLKGARGVIAKQRMARDLLTAIRAVAEGGQWFPSSRAVAVLASERSPEASWWPAVKNWCGRG